MTIAELINSLKTHEPNTQVFEIQMSALTSTKCVTADELKRLSEALSQSRIRDLRIKFEESRLVRVDTAKIYAQIFSTLRSCEQLEHVTFEKPNLTNKELDLIVALAAAKPTLKTVTLTSGLPQKSISQKTIDALKAAKHTPAIVLDQCDGEGADSSFLSAFSRVEFHNMSLNDDRNDKLLDEVRANSELKSFTFWSDQKWIATPNIQFLGAGKMWPTLESLKLVQLNRATDDEDSMFVPTTAAKLATLKKFTLGGHFKKLGYQIIQGLLASNNQWEELDLSHCNLEEDDVQALLTLLNNYHRPLILRLPYRDCVWRNKDTLLANLKKHPQLQVYITEHGVNGPTSVIELIKKASLSNHVQMEFERFDDLLGRSRNQPLQHFLEMRQLLETTRATINASKTVPSNLDVADDILTADHHDLEKISQWTWRALQWRLLMQPLTANDTQQLLSQARSLFALIDPYSSVYIDACVCMKELELQHLPSDASISLKESVELRYLEKANKKILRDAGALLHDERAGNYPKHERHHSADGIAERFRQLEGARQLRRNDDDDGDVFPVEKSSSHTFENVPLVNFSQSQILSIATALVAKSSQKTDRFLLHSLENKNGKPSVARLVLQKKIKHFPEMEPLLEEWKKQQASTFSLNSDAYKEYRKKCYQALDADYVDSNSNTDSDSDDFDPPEQQMSVEQQKRITAWSQLAVEESESLLNDYEKFTSSEQTISAKGANVFYNLRHPRGWSALMRAAYGRIDTDIAAAVEERLNQATLAMGGAEEVRDIMLQGLEIQHQRHGFTPYNSCARRMLMMLLLANKELAIEEQPQAQVPTAR